MDTTTKTKITVETTVNAPIEKVWNCWTAPEHIMQWNNASDDWHTPYAENNLQVGGQFLARMAARDGSMSFDFVGTYSVVENKKKICYAIIDGREVEITFTPIGAGIHIVETFEAETENPIEMQQGGWQAILDNFKKHTESLV